MKKAIKILMLVTLVLCFCMGAYAADETITEPIYTTETTSIEMVNTYETLYDPDWVDGGSGDSLLESLFGSYTPYNADGAASVDYAWIADSVVFIVLVVCLMKLLGGVVKRV